jgi:hypothetical protein
VLVVPVDAKDSGALDYPADRAILECSAPQNGWQVTVMNDGSSTDHLSVCWPERHRRSAPGCAELVAGSMGVDGERVSSMRNPEEVASGFLALRS